jgi:hypothetical protein
MRNKPPKSTGIVRLAFFLCTAIVTVASPCVAADRYVRAVVDQAGVLRIETSAGRAIVPAKESGQVGVDKVAISPDGRAVGWVALFPNCCTSYPIPLKLVVYSDGKRRAFTGIGLPVWRWHFTAVGRQIAFEQETVHGGLGVHYELRDVASGRSIAEWEPTIGPDNQPLENQQMPTWASDLDAKQ